MAELSLTYLNGPDIDRLALTNDEILAAVEVGLIAPGEHRTVIEPRVHLIPDPATSTSVAGTAPRPRRWRWSPALPCR